MQSIFQSIFGTNSKPEPSVCFIGTAVSDGNTLINSLKTGNYSPQQGSIHPLIQEGFKLGSSTVKLIVCGANEGDRRNFQAQLSDYTGNAIVYLLDERHEEGTSKKELHDILELSEISAISILILALTPIGSEAVSDIATKLDLEDRITSQKEAAEGRPVGLFVVSLPLNKGYQEAFDWLSNYL